MQNNQTKEHFNIRYKNYGFFSPRDIQFVIYDKRIWDFAGEFLKKSKVVVDLGAGGGTLLYNISKITSAKLIAVDFSEVSVEYLKNMVPMAEVKKDDVTKTSLKNESCDFVVSTMTIEHVDDNNFLAESYRILKTGGHLLVTTVLKNKRAWYFYKDKCGRAVLEPSHLREYDSLGNFLVLLETRGFSILKTETPRIKYPLIDPLLKILFGFPENAFWNSLPAAKPLEFIRKISRIPIPGYYAIEVVAQKR